MKQVNRDKILLISVPQAQWCHRVLTEQLNEKLERKKLILGQAQFPSQCSQLGESTWPPLTWIKEQPLVLLVQLVETGIPRAEIAAPTGHGF